MLLTDVPIIGLITMSTQSIWLRNIFGGTLSFLDTLFSKVGMLMLGRRKKQLFSFSSSILLIYAILLLLGTQKTRAEPPPLPLSQVGKWSTPSLVFAPEYTVADQGFTIAADSSGRLHVFFSYVALDENGYPLPEYPYNTILYTYSDDGVQWSEPVDIFIPDVPKRWQGAGIDVAIDSVGNIHLVFGGGPNGGGALKYAKAHVSVASNAQSWQEPKSGDWGMSVTKAAILVDQTDKVHIVYSSRPGDVYYRYSVDHGNTWSPDSRISDIDPNRSVPDDVAIAVDTRGRIHVAWSENEMPGGYPPLGVFYAYSDDGGQTWNTPKRIGDQYASRPAIAVRKPNEVHLVWGSSAQDKGRYAAASFDGGESWTEPQQVGVPGSVGGDTGLTVNPEQLVVDSAGTLHWFMASDFADVYARREPGGQWSRPIVVTLPSAPGWTKDPHFSGNKPVIVAGNQLHLIVREGARKQQNEHDRYWHTMMVVDAPALPLEPVPTVTPTLTSTVERTNTPKATPLPKPIATREPNISENPNEVSSPALPIIIGILPVTLLVLAVVGYWFTKR